MAEDLRDHLDDENYIAGHLSTSPQHRLNWIDRNFAFLATPIGKKLLGIEGWTRTSCSASGYGIITEIAHSNDGFYTIDASILTLAIACNHRGGGSGTATLKYPHRWIRLEIKPNYGPAHKQCETGNFQKTDRIYFQGPILIDHDGGWYEIHATFISRA